MNSPNPLTDVGRVLLGFGIAFVVLGALMIIGVKLPFRFGRLPGDIVYQGRHGSFYFPIVSCIVLSLIQTLLMWITDLFRR